jgi:hypothetical protein
VEYSLKARTVEPEIQPVLSNGCVKYNNDAVFSVWSVQGYITSTRVLRWRRESKRVEVGSNTSTVALRVVVATEREPSAWGWVITGYPVPSGCKYGDLALQVGGLSIVRQ